MKTRLLTIVSRLSNPELLAQVQHLARHEREATVSLIAHLAVLDERQLYLGEGCSSLFTYCVEILHLSEHAAYGRIQAARAARKFPIVLERLASGSLNLTTLGLLAPHLTAENHLELLDAAKHRSKRRVEGLVAAVRPLPAVPSSIRKMSVARAAVAPDGNTLAMAQAMTSSATQLGMLTAATVVGRGTPPATLPAMDFGTAPVGPGLQADVSEQAWMTPVPATPRAVIVALSPDQYKVQFTASAATHAKLRRVQELLRHQIPDGDPAAVIDRALTVLLAQLEKTKLAATDRPRPGRPARRGSRHIPAAVRRVVWKRDGGRCAFVSESGRRCTEKGFLQLHHVDPHGDGGEASVENIQLRCRAHNQYEADLYFGPSNQVARRKSGVRESPAVYGPARLGIAATGLPLVGRATGSGPSFRVFGTERARNGTLRSS